MKKKLSVFIITYNEAKIIAKCLERLAFADEIIVVDSGSTDQTVSICESFGAKVVYKKFNGFGEQKQFALDQTSNDWVLSLDADEILTDGLISEMQQVLSGNQTGFSGYEIKRKHIFLGKIFNYGYESSRYFLRFFNKKQGGFNRNMVHESVELTGKVGKLKNAFLHYSYDSLDTYIAKLNHYTRLYAQTKFEKGKKYGFWEIILKSKFELFKKLIIELNFLNGREGILWSFYSMVYTFTKCAKTNELHKMNK